MRYIWSQQYFLTTANDQNVGGLSLQNQFTLTNKKNFSKLKYLSIFHKKNF